MEGACMGQTYGIEAAQGERKHEPAQPPVRYMVLIDSAGAGGRVARLFLATLQEVAEFDASAPEVLSAIDGLVPKRDGLLPRWDGPLAGHSRDERAGADIYAFEI